MSRGLGWLQREILDTLDEARAAKPVYRGGTSAGREMFRDWLKASAGDRNDDVDFDAGPGWVVTYSTELQLPEGVYDLRASCAFLATRHDATYAGRYLRGSFQASFSRAVRGLVQRGHLQWVDHLSFVWNDGGDPTVMQPIRWHRPQRRFVRRGVVAFDAGRGDDAGER